MRVLAMLIRVLAMGADANGGAADDGDANGGDAQ